MVKKGPSQSAGIIAAHRALESSKNPEERICYDSLARDFLPKGFTVIGKHEISEKDALEIFQQIVPGFHEFFIARTRYIDDYLKKIIKRGFQQLVILGAGYDSRAYRFDGLNKNINVFEVDNHATQSIKKKKVNEIFNELPDYVTYVSVDLQNDNLESCLTQNGYDSQLKTFFILEGVTMYIDPKTVDGTLSFISKNTAKGSEIIFDYTYPEVISGTCERKEAQEWLRIAQKSDERLLFGIGNDHLEKFLADRNFHNIICITNDYFNNKYYSGVNDDRAATPVLSIAHAEVFN